MREERRSFKHLTMTARLQIESLLKAKVSIKEIANQIGVHISTIYNELKRGRYMHLNGATWEYEERYSPDIAHEKYREHLKNKGADIKLGKDYDFAEYIERRIIEGKLSPGAVLGEIKCKRLQFNTSICLNTLYKYIERGYFSRLSIQHLTMKQQRRKHRRRVTISRAPRGTSIERRPIEILERKSFGHWEMDCVCGPTLNTLLVLTERLTRKEIIMPMKNQKSESVISSLNKIERKYGALFKRVFKSITVDNGTEFSDFTALQRSIYGRGAQRTSVYYCHPYCSSERGTNERINREIRRLIPKGSDLSKYSELDIQRVEDWVNNYPRQIFGYVTSEERFREEIAKLRAA